MPKQGYLSISEIAYDTMGYPSFEKLKNGYIGQRPNGEPYEIVSGIPKTARLNMVIYVYEDDSLPESEGNEFFDQPSATVMTRNLKTQ